jgi:CrcB protein
MPKGRRHVWQQVLWQMCWLAFLGALGTIARFYLDLLVQRIGGTAFPWGILIVNLAGCFAFGFVYPLAGERFLISGETRLLILTGFMGAFTTFSTFTFQTAEFLRNEQWFQAFANVAAQVVGGLVLMFLGIALGSRV